MARVKSFLHNYAQLDSNGFSSVFSHLLVKTVKFKSMLIQSATARCLPETGLKMPSLKQKAKLKYKDIQPISNILVKGFQNLYWNWSHNPPSSHWIRGDVLFSFISQLRPRQRQCDSLTAFLNSQVRTKWTILKATIPTLGHTDPQPFIQCLIYVCLGLSQSKDFTLQASGPQ